MKITISQIDIKIVGGKRIPLSEVVSIIQTRRLGCNKGHKHPNFLVVLKILIQMQKKILFYFYFLS